MNAITERCRSNFKPQNIPADLKAIKGWVVWAAKDKAKNSQGSSTKFPITLQGKFVRALREANRTKHGWGHLSRHMKRSKKTPNSQGWGWPCCLIGDLWLLMAMGA